VEDARRAIPFATVLGIALVAALYIASSLAVMGLVPRETLAASSAPYAEAARVLWGPTGGALVAAGAAVACFGALNGWILCTGQFSLAVARDGLFPRGFARTTRSGAPAAGVLIACGLAAVLVAARSSGSLVAMFRWMILLSTLSSVVPLRALHDGGARADAARAPEREPRADRGGRSSSRRSRSRTGCARSGPRARRPCSGASSRCSRGCRCSWSCRPARA
jgi:amino acid permease